VKSYQVEEILKNAVVSEWMGSIDVE